VSPTLDAFLRSWAFDPWLLAALLVSAAVYLRGWLVLRCRDPRRWHAGSLAAFLGGLAAIYLALASPIEPFAALLLLVHMVQHLLLMMVAPPLLWLGAPLFPLLRGLPRPVRTYWVAPVLASPPLRRFFGRLTHPLAALPIFVAVTLVWHVPPVYELALRSNGWHCLQHVCFLCAGLLFWYPVVRPYPSRPRWSGWLLLPYLIVADLSNTVLSAVLTFSDRVLYPYYAEVPRLGGLSAVEDQSTAGVLMWVPGSLAFLLPLFAISLRLLYGARPDEVSLPTHRAGPTALPPRISGRLSLPLVADRSTGHPATQRSIDLLRIPLLGRFLKWRHARLALQLPLFLLAVVLVIDGFRGPPVSAMNLAGVLPWIHWRGLLILSLLIGGNIFCLACPFLLPRTLARRLLPATRPWPRWLRSKWLAVVLLVLFLWAYEAFALWDSPWLTTWIVIAYFLAAFVIDGLFKGASFCKYVCPIGQFNFLLSLMSPLEIKARNPAVCASCRTKDCIRGRDGIPGCELDLYQPRKAGNLDCTFCLDCIHACPHDNIGLLPVTPGQELWHDPQRSGLGRLSRRPDLAVLAVVLTFGAFANAAGMVGPVSEWQQGLSSWLGLRSSLLAVSAFYVCALILLPALLVGGAAMVSHHWARLSGPWLRTATRFSFALLPLGFAMWFSHYSFHFVTSYETVVPTTQRFVADMGWISLGEPDWQCSCCRPPATWLLRMEIVALDVGLLLSLYTAYRIGITEANGPAAPSKAVLPWALLLVLLFAVGIWILFQPMQMRGTMGMGG